MSDLIGPRFMRWLETLHHYSIMNPDENTGQMVAYLTRYHLAQLFGFKMFIHNIHKSDGDRELHSHPWPWLGIILKGGYWEHRLSGVFRRRPGQLMLVGRSKLHRVELPEGRDSWSLVIVTPRGLHSWLFLTKKGLVPWITFLRTKGIPIDHI